jgi:hypothetical protein
LQNILMRLDLLFFDFFERVAMGAATVFALLLAVGLRMPRRVTEERPANRTAICFPRPTLR